MNVSSHRNCAFVFVVCGGKEYIKILNFSIKALKKFTKQDIIVVTDLKRNEESIDNSIIIDIETPTFLSNHQASIWLKTSLHKILPKERLYCYLDSDIIALNSDCNSIFNFFVPPITFAKDHTTLSYFSPSAVNCDCKAKNETANAIFEQSVASIIKHPNYPPDYKKKEIRKIIALQNKINTSLYELFHFCFKFFLSYLVGKIKISNDISINVREKQLEVSNNFPYPILTLYRNRIKEKGGYTFNFIKRQWTKNNQLAILPIRCNHLQQALKETFNIDVPANWQHWNGGVFIFNNGSYDFMELWHNNTNKIFSNNYWKIRDQGTLLATIFQMNLQKHYTLPTEFNFIADFYKMDIYPHPKIKNQFFYGNKTIKPNFIHIYHHFGDENWDVWQRIIEILKIPI